MISVRAARDSDLESIVELNRDVQRLHADLEPSFFKADLNDRELRTFFAAKIAAAGNHFRLADAGGSPCGYVWFEVQDRPETPLTHARKRIYIHHLSVHATARRRGVASVLIRHVETEARTLQIECVALDAWAANEAAHACFKACGFTPFDISYRKQVP